MSYVSLSFTLLFIIITMLISVRKKLGLEKDILVGTIRAAIQLIAIGYVHIHRCCSINKHYTKHTLSSLCSNKGP